MEGERIATEAPAEPARAAAAEPSGAPDVALLQRAPAEYVRAALARLRQPPRRARHPAPAGRDRAAVQHRQGLPPRQPQGSALGEGRLAADMVEARVGGARGHAHVRRAARGARRPRGHRRQRRARVVRRQGQRLLPQPQPARPRRSPPTSCTRCTTPSRRRPGSPRAPRASRTPRSTARSGSR